MNKLKVTYYTNKGNRSRNEDSILVYNKILSEVDLESSEEVIIHPSKEGIVFGIADGIGGRPSGSLASYLALKILSENSKIRSLDDFDKILEKILKAFHQEVEKNHENEGMGTTLSALILRKNKWYILHMGDTRIYQWKKETHKIQLLTNDHTHVQELVKKGFLKFEDINQHPLRNFLSSAITTNVSDLKKIEYQKSIIEEHNTFFLCSDGVWENFTDKQLNLLFSKNTDHIKIANKIIEKCEENGSKDNFSFIIIENH